jgi:hypothetical protein
MESNKSIGRALEITTVVIKLILSINLLSRKINS